MSLQAVILSLFLIFSISSFAIEDSADKSNGRGQVFFKPLQFAAGVAPTNTESECLMLEELKDSIIKSARDFNLEINFLDENSNPHEATVIQVQFIEVGASRWRFGSVRPYSTARYYVTIYEDGELLDSETRALNSAVALGACNRLEKISKAFGPPIMHWVFQHIGNDKAAVSSLAMLNSDNAIFLREIARKLYNNADFNEDYLDAAAQKIGASKYTKDRNMIDALAWLCKYIGLSENGRYRTFFESLEKDLKRGKLKKYVKSTLKKLPDEAPQEEQFKIEPVSAGQAVSE